jgi:hypothetical protein
MYPRWIYVLTLALLSSATYAQAQNRHMDQDSMVVRYYNRGALDARHAYKFELIEKALEITRPEYGDYLIKPYKLQPSAKRQSILMNEGKLLNIIWGSPGTHHAQGDVMAIPIDILRGLLGYRICLITNATKSLDKIKRLEDLQALRIGQTIDWADIAIYQNNGINPIEASTYESMFEMLSFNRFDCLALGANEVLLAYREKKITYQDFAIDPKLLIAYEYPIYFYISKKFPALAERIKLGLERMQKNGAFDQLFYKHFANDLEILALGKRNIICLQSPYLEPNQQTCPKARDMDFITPSPIHKLPKIKSP